MHIPGKLFGSLSAAVILTYLAVVALGYYMPLQNDEVNWLIQNDRAWIDNQSIIYLFPQCGKEVFAHPLPLLWYIPAYVNYLTYAQIDNPIWIRIAGIFQFLLWLGLFVLIVMKLFRVPRKYWWAALALVLALLGLDALPLALLINRPEQILLIGVGTCTVWAMYTEYLSRTLPLRIVSTFWLFFVMLYVHSSHPKAIAMLPLELAMASVFLHKAWRSRIVMLLGIATGLVIGIESYLVEMARVQCPQSAEARQFLLEAYLPLQTIWKAPLTFLTLTIKNIIASSVAQFYPAIYFDVGHIWLPLSLHPLTTLTSSLVHLLDVYGWCLHFGLFLFACWIGCSYFIASRKTRFGQIEPFSINWLGLWALLAYIAALMIFMTEGVYYAVTLTLPLIALASLFAISFKYPLLSVKGIILVLLAAATLNQLLLLDRYAGFIATPEEYASLDINQKAFIPTQGYAEKKRAALELALECHIGTGPDTHHLVIDEATYNLFHYTSQPLYFSYSTFTCCHKEKARPSGRIAPDSMENGAPWFNASEYLRLLKHYDSDGIIAQCSRFPDSLRALSTEHSGFCCIPAAVIKNSP